jgi:hypothetical protein
MASFQGITLMTGALISFALVFSQGGLKLPRFYLFVQKLEQYFPILA